LGLSLLFIPKQPIHRNTQRVRKRLQFEIEDVTRTALDFCDRRSVKLNSEASEFP